MEVIYYCGGYAVLLRMFSTFEGYLNQYIEGCSVLYGNNISTVEDVQCLEKISPPLEITYTIFPTVLNLTIVVTMLNLFTTNLWPAPENKLYATLDFRRYRSKIIVWKC